MPSAPRTVDRSEAFAGSPPASPAPQPADSVRFIRTMSADAPLDLGEGKTVSFHVPVDNVTGVRAAYGWYETSDPVEIRLLRTVVAEKPYLYVFEE